MTKRTTEHFHKPQHLSAASAMDKSQTRSVGPNELRCIARQSLDLYRTLIVGGVYTVNRSQNVNIESQAYDAIKFCVSKHPILSAVIEAEETQKPRFAKAESLDLRNHLWLRHLDEDAIFDDTRLERTLEQLADTPLGDRSKIPPWRVAIYKDGRPSQEPSHARDQYLILLCYYHSHGDGMAGLAFAKTFLQGLNEAASAPPASKSSTEIKPSTSPFLPPIEKAAKLTISWSYLLSPLLGEYLPGFIADLFGFSNSPFPKAGDQWAGQRAIDPQGLQTGTKILSIPAAEVNALLQGCRKRECKLTGLLHQLVVRALSSLLPADTPANCFVTQSAVDLRRNIPSFSEDDMALCVTGYYETIPRATQEQWANWTSGDSTHPVWAAVKRTTEGLASTASTLHDQPIGMLKYLLDMRRWILGQMGKPRECSYEMSNLRAFEAPRKEGNAWDVQAMIFSQPANLSGGCFDVNVVSRKGGELTVVFCWQLRALAVDDERKFMAQVTRLIGGYIRELAGSL